MDVYRTLSVPAKSTAVLLALAAFLLVGTSRSAWADASLQLALRPEASEVGQTVELSVTIDGATGIDGEPRVPPVDGLRFRRAGQQTNFSLVNGRMSRSITFQFLLVADRAGEYTIGPVEVQVGKETLRSGKAKLQIVASGTPLPGATAAPAPGGGASGEDGLIFVEAQIDKPRVYLGQQVTLRLRFYQAVGFRVLETQLEDPPSTQGFLREEIPPQRTRTASVGGRTYQVTELVYGLFPTQTGTLEIGPATLRCTVQDRRSRSGRRDPFDLFGMFQEREVTLRSKVTSVEVLPLPRPQPETFTGGVGSFRLNSKVDRTEAEQNEPVTLTLSVEGTGNIAAIGPPAVPEIPGFRTFDGAAPTVITQKNEDRLGGKKTFQIVLVPETTGDLIIPPLELSYFRTSNGTYQSLASDSAVVRVTPGTGLAGPDGVTRLGWDLRAIRETTRIRPTGSSAPWRHTSFWLLQSGPLALLAGAWVLRRKKEHEILHQSRLARERAPGRLRKEIEALAKTSGDPSERLRTLEEIWTRYLEKRFGFALRGRTREELRQHLEVEGYGEEAISQVHELLGSLDFSRFAPGDPVALDDLLSRSRAAATLLERPGSPRKSRTAPVGLGLFLTLLLVLSPRPDGRGFAPAMAAEGPQVAGATVDESGQIDSLGSPGSTPVEILGTNSPIGIVTDSPEDALASGDPGPVDGTPVDRAQADSWFSEANQAFQAGQTRLAVELYRRILEAGYESPDVWLNLGNAHFRLGEKGWAVHAFESGRRMAPGDPDLRSNLELALRDVETAPEVEGNRILEALAASRDAFPLRQALPLVTALWWGLAAWAAWSLYRRTVGGVGILLGLVLGLGWLAGLGWLGVLAVQANTRPDAVVVVESAAVRSNPESRATVEFHLPEGTLFRTGREAPGFIEVLYSDELRGWTAGEGTALIGKP